MSHIVRDVLMTHRVRGGREILINDRVHYGLVVFWCLIQFVTFWWLIEFVAYWSLTTCLIFREDALTCRVSYLFEKDKCDRYCHTPLHTDMTLQVSMSQNFTNSHRHWTNVTNSQCHLCCTYCHTPGYAEISRLFKISGLFCRIQSLFIGLSCKRDLQFLCYT